MKINFKKPHLYYFIIILYGAFMILVTTGFNNVFGSEIDWVGQHTAFPEVFRQNFYITGRILPNFVFEIGSGQNIFNFAYYGFLSPMFIPSYFLPFIDLITYTSVMGIIQYIASGILIYIFLKKHLADTDSFLCAILFLSMAPVAVHARYNIMFVWYIPFLLLALLGLDRYFSTRKSLLFILSTICIILTNFYFSLGCLICLFVYAIYRILNDYPYSHKSFFSHLLKIIHLFIIPVFICAFFLLPSALAIISGNRPFTNQTSFKQLLLHLPGNIFYEFFSYGLTATMIIALISNLFSKDCGYGEKFLNTVLLIFTVSPLFPYLLNGTLYLNSKVMIPFLPLYILAFGSFLKNIKSRNVKILIPAILTLFFLMSCFLLHRSQEKRVFMVIAEIAIFLLSFRKKHFIYLYTLVFILCGLFNNKIPYASYKFVDNMYFEEINSMMKTADNGIYRTNVSYMDKYTCNRAFGEKFLGVSSYSSTPNSRFLDFYENHSGNNESQSISIMLAGSRNEQFYNFMGTRYIFSKTDPGFFYEKIKSGKNINMYENRNAYPLVYKSRNLISESDFEKAEFPYNTEILAHRTVVKNAVSSKDVSNIKEYPVTSDYRTAVVKTYSYDIVLDEVFKNKYLYLTFELDNTGKFENLAPVEIVINGVGNTLNEKRNPYYNKNTKFEYVIPMENTSTLNITISRGKYNFRNIKLYYSDVSQEHYVQADNLTLNRKNDTVSCSVDAAAGEYLATSIPYDKGFTATINGKDAEIEIVNKAFIGLKLENGKNDIVFKYKSPGLTVGTYISILGIILLIAVTIREKARAKHSHFKKW